MRQLVNWKDHVVEFPERYQDTDLGEGYTQHRRAPGAVVQQGTPLSAANFNNMDFGIHESALISAILLQHVLTKDNAVQGMFEERDAHLAGLDSETVPETGTVVLTNTAKQPFNNSSKTVAFSSAKKNLNYIVECVVSKVEGGCLGDIQIFDKALNGFKVAFDGSAKSVTIKYMAKGGTF